MKTEGKIILFLVLLVLGVSSAPAIAGVRPRLGVFKFTFDVEGIGEGVSDILTRELANSGRFDVIERTELETLLKEIDFQPSKYVEQETAVPLGELKGVDYILIGKITGLGYGETDKALGGVVGELIGLGGIRKRSKTARAQFDIRLIEVRTGRVVLAETAEGTETKKGVTLLVATSNGAAGVNVQSTEFRESMIGRATYKAIGQVLLKLYDKFPVQGEVLVRDGDIVVVDLDERVGLAVGSLADVFKKEVMLNDKGEVVWETLQQVGTIRVKETALGRSLCEIITGRNEITPGMIVKPQEEKAYLPPEAVEEQEKKNDK